MCGHVNYRSKQNGSDSSITSVPYTIFEQLTFLLQARLYHLDRQYADGFDGGW